MANPFASREVRWFLEGSSSQHPELLHWFVSFAPFRKDRATGPPEWRSRLGGKPDIYLLLPGADDMGLKWREGTLQVKGLVEEPGPQGFAGRHEGRVQRWVKWTYDRVSPEIRAIFQPATGQGRCLVPVAKTRALRMFGLDAGDPVEYAPGLRLDRGVGIDLTDIVLGDTRYCTLAFEAFPDDARVRADQATPAGEAPPEFGFGEHRLIVADFAAAILAGRQPAVSVRDVMPTIALVEAMYASARREDRVAVDL